MPMGHIFRVLLEEIRLNFEKKSISVINVNNIERRKVAYLSESISRGNTS